VGVLISNAALGDDNVTGRVVAVIDGNTIEVCGNDREVHTVLLMGIDSPELGQAYGDVAKKFLEKIILAKTVTVQFQGKDRFGNFLAIVMIHGTRDPRIELLKEGLAWTSEKNPLEDLESHRSIAQRNGRGLWKQANPIPPWIYRKQLSMMQPKSR
jgi:micrococcal nuclease